MDVLVNYLKLYFTDKDAISFNDKYNLIKGRTYFSKQINENTEIIIIFIFDKWIDNLCCSYSVGDIINHVEFTFVNIYFNELVDDFSQMHYDDLIQTHYFVDNNYHINNSHIYSYKYKTSFTITNVPIANPNIIQLNKKICNNI